MADTTLTARETVLVNAITEQLGKKAFSVDNRSNATVPDSNGGQYRALQSDIENVRSEFHDFKSDVNLRFSEISTGIKGLEQSIGRLALSPSPAAANGESKTWIIGVATICLALASAFGAVVKMNIDSNVSYAQERTTTAEKHLTDDLSGLTQVVKRLQETTIPRSELDNRIGANEVGITNTRRTQDDHTKQIASLISDMAYVKADVERFKTIAVSRSEIDSTKNDTINRINLLSNRISDISKDFSALPIVVENQRQIRSDLNELTRKFVQVPK